MAQPKETPKRDGFKPRSGLFACGICERGTRQTSQGNSHLCPQCDEWTMAENGIVDGAYEGNPQGLATAEAYVRKLKEQAAAKGGNREALGLDVAPAPAVGETPPPDVEPGAAQ